MCRWRSATAPSGCGSERLCVGRLSYRIPGACRNAILPVFLCLFIDLVHLGIAKDLLLSLEITTSSFATLGHKARCVRMPQRLDQGRKACFLHSDLGALNSFVR